MRGRRPWITVTVEGRAAFVKGGPNVVALIEAVGGRPVWVGRRRSWSTSSRRVSDLIALAERNGYAIAYDGGEAA